MDFERYFTSIMKASDHHLSWEEPEHWVRSELFQRLKEDEPKTGLSPLAMEVPYYTTCPYSKKADAVPPYGKWIDLCVLNQDKSEWIWIDIKVVRSRNHGAAAAVMLPLACDAAALMGFSVPMTLEGWEVPKKGMSLKKVGKFLVDSKETMRAAKHRFYNVQLILNDKASDFRWEKPVLDAAIRTRIRALDMYQGSQPLKDYEFKAVNVGSDAKGVEGELIVLAWS